MVTQITSEQFNPCVLACFDTKKEWSVGRRTEGEENDEVEEQMGVLALPTENPNQRKITPPTSLSDESSCFKLWTEKENTKARNYSQSRSKCPWWTLHFVRLDFFSRQLTMK